MKKINHLKIFVMMAIMALVTSCGMEGSEVDFGGSDQIGRGGSMASFSIVGNNLYIVNGTDLKTYDISKLDEPQLSSNVDFGRVLETTFVLGNHLYVGSQSGMLIYDISNPQNPNLLSVYDHVTSCDPVVVTGNIAYVTLRDGTECTWGDNLLDILDVSDKTNPQLLNSISMINPHGLAVDGNLLFVCEGKSGLKVFDITERVNPILIDHVTGIETYDVLAINGKLIITGSGSFLIYDYSDLEDIKHLYTMSFN